MYPNKMSLLLKGPSYIDRGPSPGIPGQETPCREIFFTFPGANFVENSYLNSYTISIKMALCEPTAIRCFAEYNLAY